METPWEVSDRGRLKREGLNHQQKDDSAHCTQLQPGPARWLGWNMSLRGVGRALAWGNHGAAKKEPRPWMGFFLVKKPWLCEIRYYFKEICCLYKSTASNINTLKETLITSIDEVVFSMFCFVSSSFMKMVEGLALPRMNPLHSKRGSLMDWVSQILLLWDNVWHLPLMEITHSECPSSFQAFYFQLTYLNTLFSFSITHFSFLIMRFFEAV